MDEKLFMDAREEYIALDDESRANYLNMLMEQYGQEWVDAFKSFMETGNFPKFAEAVKTIPELNAGVVMEGGTTLAEGYERTPEQVSASLATEHAPVYEVVKAMADEYQMATPKAQEDMIKRMGDARGEEFSEAVRYTFENKDFCEYVARETQTMYDTLAKNFSESKNKKQTLSNMMNFSENVAGGLLDYVSSGRVGNGAVLESIALVSNVARRNFSETGDLADAIEELGEGEVAPEAAETVAENIIAHKDNDADKLEEKIEAAADNMEKDAGVDMSEADNAGGEVMDTAGGEDAVLREKEQNNAMLDAVVEKYKALQTDEAKAAMVQAMNQVLDANLVDYIVKRAEGEDFSEEDGAKAEVVEKEEVDIKEAPKAAAEKPETSEEGDLDRYETLSHELLGEYAGNPEAAQLVASTAPVAVATLPEGAPTSATEAGVTMAEGYERNDLMDQYEEMGLLN